MPTALRQDIKQEINSSHMEAGSCLCRARKCVFRPKMNAEINEMIAMCKTCRKFEANQPKEPLMPVETPSRPWEISSPSFKSFKDFLIKVGYFSNYWEIDKLSNTLVSTVVLKLESHFKRNRYPNQVISDNGPQFTSDTFQKFASTWEFEYLTSSPGNPKQTGKRNLL